MSFMKFGEYLVRNSGGKVLGQHIAVALSKQKLKDGHKKLGEILVDDKILTSDELTKYLDEFEKLREGS